MSETIPASARAKATRAAILAAATAEFAEHGPHGARVDRIAERSGANKERIYAYFGSKGALFAAALERAFGEVAESEMPLVESVQPQGMAKRILAHYFAIHERQPHLWRLLAWANLAGAVDARLSPTKAPAYAGLSRVYAQAQRDGVFPAEVSFPTFAYAMIALSLVAFANRRTLAGHLALELDEGESRDRLISELALLIEGPRRGAGA